MSDALTPYIFPAIDPYRPDTASTLHRLGFKAADIEPEWLAQLRKDGMDTLFKTGLPTPLLERWKYTNLAQAVQDMDLSYADSGFMDAAPVGLAGGDEKHMSQNWVQTMLAKRPPQQGRFDDHILWSMGQAYFKNTVVIDVAEGQTPEPASLNFEGIAGQFTQTHIIIRLAPGTALTVNENHTGWGAYWRNTNTVIEVGEGATLTHIRMMGDSDEAVSTHSCHVCVAAGGRYAQEVLLTNGALLRNDFYARLDGPKADARIHGALLGRDNALLDQTILIDHQAPDCTSYQMFRNILQDRATCVFQGKVYVDQIAQRTDGYQLCNSVLLSEMAEMLVKPELEIYADDVKCSHGATMGELDADALFYCRARGIPEAQARRLLLESFLTEALESEKLLEKARGFLNNV